MTRRAPLSETPTILVIDDDALIRLMAAESLGEAGYSVLEAGSAEDGLEAYERDWVDLVLLDVMLPGMNGYQACAELRTRPGGQNLPIVVMTGLDDRRSIREAYDSGATDFITKPIVWDLLPYRVRYALRASRALQDMVRSRALLARSQSMASMGSWEWIGPSDRLECSEGLYQIHGRMPDATAKSLQSLIDCVHPEDRATVELALERARNEGRTYGIEFRILRPDGSERRVFEQIEVERDAADAVVAVHGIRHDITQQFEANNRIRTLAHFDALTGLANRTLFRDMMQQWLPYASRHGLHCAVLYLDLDRFKLVNETLGPRIGDEVLKAVSERLRECMRGTDLKGMARRDGTEELLARLGGDEFTMLLVDVADADQAAGIARRITRSLTAPIVVEGHPMAVSASIGIAMMPQDGEDMDALLRNAGTAMHVAKSVGHNQIRFYSEDMSADVIRKVEIETDLRQALELRELQLHYQAKVDARTSDVVGAEALTRWRHPKHGAMNPAEFFPVAEESGLIGPITDWIIDEACRQQAAWQRAGLQTVPVSINLTAASLQSDRLLHTVTDALARHAVDASALEFEVTEGSLMKDLDKASRVLDQLKALGLTLSIDDFGTGYSSLTYLKRFPFDVLKIDRGFIKDLPDDANDAALTSAIIAMGRSLNLELVAEGVETWAQADFLIQRRCYMVQGWLFAKALPPDTFARLLQDGLPARPLQATASGAPNLLGNGATPS